MNDRIAKCLNVVAYLTVCLVLAGCPSLSKTAVEDSVEIKSVNSSTSQRYLPGEAPRLSLGSVSQADIVAGKLTLRQIRREGRRVFSTPFNKLDGYGDGPREVNEDPTAPGHRPTLQNNGTFLRFNGLDAQTCLECHSVISNREIPMILGIGGVGMVSSNASFMPREIDVDDSDGNGFAAFDGRFINPPFLFGSGGVELLGKEMTADLQALKSEAQANPGTDVSLETKGVSFGALRYENGVFDYSGVEGIDDDLVVKPFGRKGEFATTRSFDQGAMLFHLGMQPTEVVGNNVDADGDGIANEILPGEMSALAIFNTTLDKPVQQGAGDLIEQGRQVFESIGCATCHRPELRTTSKYLQYSFPEVLEDPGANVFFEADLSAAPTNLQVLGDGGLVVPLFADLKRHNMGPALAESFGSDLDTFFTTARLWGVADTAPYMHDGRALTLSEAILLHGGEAQAARDAFEALSRPKKADLLEFLLTLKTPRNPAADLG